MASGYPGPYVGRCSPCNDGAQPTSAKDLKDLKPELQDLVLLMRKTLRTVCDELRRIHKGNKLLEEQHRALAGQLADCEVKRSLQACQAQHSVNIANLQPQAQPSQSKPMTRPPGPPGPLPKKSALVKSDASSPEAQSDAKGQGSQSRKPSERRLTLRLSKSLLRKLSSASGVEVEDSDESGSEIFEANNPEEVLEMQNLLLKLTKMRNDSESKRASRQDSVVTWKYEELEEKRATRHDSVATSRCYEEEPETSPTRASQSKRLAPGLAEEVSRGESLPPRRFTIFSKR
mmetsp:Transcript_15630/g.34367  ORF Transcript_15630/g.34367 Transcript_15630/m.34367 type:complete len:289 (-) Transcript_15630:235-1101(-)